MVFGSTTQLSNLDHVEIKVGDAIAQQGHCVKKLGCMMNTKLSG